MPVYSNDPKKPGNAIAMEAVPVEKEKNKTDKNNNIRLIYKYLSSNYIKTTKKKCLEKITL